MPPLKVVRGYHVAGCASIIPPGGGLRQLCAAHAVGRVRNAWRLCLLATFPASRYTGLRGNANPALPTVVLVE